MPATKTDLLDRYLNAVKFWLPKAQQQDILAELAEDLQSQIEDHEAALGRNLSQDEIAAILKRRGAPMRVASGYLPDVRLIDPAMLPLYRFVLKIVLLWVFAPIFAIVLFGALFTSPNPGRLLVLFLVEGWRGAFTAVGIITTVFVLLDRFHLTGIDKWDPRKLPRVPARYETSTRWNHLAAFIFGAIGVAFWLYLMWGRTEFAIPNGPRIILARVWGYIYWLLPGLTMTGATSDLIAALRPSLTRVRSWVHIAVDATMLQMAIALLKVGNWVTIVAPDLSSEDLAKVTTWVNIGMEITLIVLALIVVGDAILEIRRLRRAGPAHPAAILTAL